MEDTGDIYSQQPEDEAPVIAPSPPVRPKKRRRPARKEDPPRKRRVAKVHAEPPPTATPEPQQEDPVAPVDEEQSRSEHTAPEPNVFDQLVGIDTGEEAVAQEALATAHDDATEAPRATPEPAHDDATEAPSATPEPVSQPPAVASTRKPRRSAPVVVPLPVIEDFKTVHDAYTVIMEKVAQQYAESSGDFPSSTILLVPITEMESVGQLLRIESELRLCQPSEYRSRRSQDETTVRRLLCTLPVRRFGPAHALGKLILGRHAGSRAAAAVRPPMAALRTGGPGRHHQLHRGSSADYISVGGPFSEE